MFAPERHPGPRRLPLAVATLAAGAVLAAALPAAAQTPPRTIDLGLGRVESPVPVALRLRADSLLRQDLPYIAFLARMEAARRRLAALTGAGFDAPGAALAALAMPAPGAIALPAAPPPAEAAQPPRRFGIAAVEGDATAPAARGGELLPAALARHAALGVHLTGAGGLGGSWQRHAPCDPALHVACSPSLLPHLRPDLELGVRVAGTVSERVHVAVDYDQRREYDAANRLRLWYEGGAGEAIRRVEVGDVTLPLPRSRFLSPGVPAGSFGVLATGRAGPLDVHALWAQQRGDVAVQEFRIAAAGDAHGLVQERALALDDADYAAGQFFYLVHPDSLAGAPAVDPLRLRPEQAPAWLRPARGGAIQLYRDERPSALNPEQRAQLGYFLADARAEGDGAERHTGLFRRLDPERDYAVHASGLWIVLRAPLRADEALAVAYRTEAGGAVGTPDAEASPGGAQPELRLLRGPATGHAPGRAAWPYEMRQAYRVDAGAAVEAGSVELVVSLGELAAGRTFRGVAGAQVSYLKLLGLDEDAPADRLDAARLFVPAEDAFDAAPLPGTWLILPMLRPFAAAALEGDANAAIYDEPDPVARAGAGRFRLNFRYRVRGDGVQDRFTLGALGVREHSERLRLGGRELVRGADYDIDYVAGVVTLRDARALLALEPGAELRVTWEQPALFQSAPTNLFGLGARWDVGGRGELHFLGMLRQERSVLARPQLGAEADALLMGGVSGSIDLGGALLDRAFGALPFLRTTTPSSARLRGELALSAPDPGGGATAYIDDFESADELPLSLRRQEWRLGSRPQSAAGATRFLPAALDVATVAPLVWQHDILLESGAIAGSVLPRRDLDRQISVAGAELPEPALWLSFGDADARADDPRWRSITTVLAPTGRDLTRADYLELYVRADADRPLALILDIGSVSEDAFFFDADGRTSGVRADGRPWGLGVLDEEAGLAAGELWSRERDALGLWDEACRAEPLSAYPLGDPRANCTRGNGRPDSEDLDGNGVLDADDGAYFRYVIEFDRVSEYLVRDTAATGTAFRLYRIPLRGIGALAVNGADDALWRHARHLRLTVAGVPSGAASRTTLTLARLRIVGARWNRRELHGVMSGRLADAPGAGAVSTRVTAGPVSRLTDGAAYASPPGVLDRVQDPTQPVGAAGVEFGERALRIAYEGLEPGERAELYLRYPQQPRSFIGYGELRLWAVAREGAWGGGGEELLVRVGGDARNFYLFRTPLRQATGPRPAAGADWLPELVIDLEPWLALKAEAERRMLTMPAAGQDTIWSEDGRHAIVFEDRARAPNLAAIREISLAVYNGGALAADGEVWINDVRLGAARRTGGGAGVLELELHGGEALHATVAYSRSGASFRHADRPASYLGRDELSVRAGAQLDRALPAAWGIDLPVSVTHVRSAEAPLFLERSDVRADRLDGVRTSGSGTTRVSATLRRRAPMASPLLGALLDGASARAGYTASHASGIAARSEASGFDAGVAWRAEPVARALDIAGTRLRWTPRALDLATGWTRHESRAWRYERILALDDDTLVAPVLAPRTGLENSARIALAPFPSLSAQLDVRSERDLLDPARAATRTWERDALAAGRARVAGVDIGRETRRNVSTTVSWRPHVSAWLRPAWSYGSRYGADAAAAWLELEVDGADTTAVLQRRFLADRGTTTSVVLDAARLTSAAAALLPLHATFDRRVGSRFDGQPRGPGLAYQLGLGSFEALRVVHGDTAASARRRDELRLAGGVRLGAGAQFEVAFGDIAQRGLERIGGERLVHERSWPSVRLHWPRLPLPAALADVVTSASLGAGAERVDRDTRIGGPAAPRRATDELRFPMHAGVVIGAIGAAYTGTHAAGSSTDPTGSAGHASAAHAVQLTARWRPAPGLAAYLPSPVSTSLAWTTRRQRQCRHAPDDGGCLPFLDSGVSALALTVETVLAHVATGVQISYNSRTNRVGMTGDTRTLQIGIYGRLDYRLGTFPDP